MTGREKTKEPDADEAPRQGVGEKAGEKLFSRKRHVAGCVLVPGVFPTKRDLTVLEIHESVVGDGDPMRVTGQVMEDVFGPAERRLGVDDPINVMEWADKGGESFRIIQCRQIAIET